MPAVVSFFSMSSDDVCPFHSDDLNRLADDLSINDMIYNYQ